MGESYLQTLAHEFRAGQDSFLLQLRVDFYWDKEAFHHLTEAMRTCCEHYQYSQEHSDLERKNLEQLTDKQLDEYLSQKKDLLLPRWLANGFWSLSTFVHDHTSHPYWGKIVDREPAYYTKAYKQLDDLVSWFFEGQAPWSNEEEGWTSTSF